MISCHIIKLKSHRKRSGLTQEELGFLLGLKKHSTVSRYEAGDRDPDLRTALAYKLLFDSDLRELFPGLFGEIRAELAARARGLCEQIKAGGNERKAAFKLRKLAEFDQGNDGNAPDAWA
jgi:transcriptional regulator with XRE-family HTH domain